MDPFQLLCQSEILLGTSIATHFTRLPMYLLCTYAVSQSHSPQGPQGDDDCIDSRLPLSHTMPCPTLHTLCGTYCQYYCYRHDLDMSLWALSGTRWTPIAHLLNPKFSTGEIMSMPPRQKLPPANSPLLLLGMPLSSPGKGGRLNSACTLAESLLTIPPNGVEHRGRIS